VTNAQVQMFNNAVAVLRERCVLDLVERSRGEVKSDRVYFPVRDTDRDLLVFRLSFGVGSKPSDFESWGFYWNHGKTAVKSWREKRAEDSMQLVLHEDRGQCRLEVDFDYYRPGWDLWRTFGHIGEVLKNRICRVKTDPFEIARRRGLPIVTDLPQAA
jgi:hypothetical protein